MDVQPSISATLTPRILVLPVQELAQAIPSASTRPAERTERGGSRNEFTDKSVNPKYQIRVQIGSPWPQAQTEGPGARASQSNGTGESVIHPRPPHRARAAPVQPDAESGRSMLALLREQSPDVPATPPISDRLQSRGDARRLSRWARGLALPANSHVAGPSGERWARERCRATCAKVRQGPSTSARKGT